MIEVITIVPDRAPDVDEATQYLDAINLDYRPAIAYDRAIEAFVDSEQRELVKRQLIKLGYAIVEGD